MRAAGLALPLLLVLPQACAPNRPVSEPPEVPLPTVVPEPWEAGKPPPRPPEWIASSRVPEFAKCAPCHNAEQGGNHGLGPNLCGASGSRAASKPDYRYSPAMKESGLVWDFATLDRFLENPRAVVPGTKMTFSGLKRPEERKAVIAFLKLRSSARR